MELHIYSAADIGLSDTFANWFSSPSSTVAGTVSPDTLTLSDDDPNFEDEAEGLPQVLTQDFYVDGVLVGSIGDTLVNLGQSAVTNNTTGEAGFLVVIQVNGEAVGYASTIPLNAGDSLSMTAWAGTSTSIAFDELLGPPPTCFASGTMIETDNGEVVIDALQVGDKIRTMDNGWQEIRWIGSTTVAAKGNYAPVVFAKGVFGNTQELILSQFHRILLQGPRAELLFGDPEVLCAARNLVDGDRIYIRAGGKIKYFHILFDTHQIVFSNGMATESFLPDENCLNGMARNTREEILDLFPELRTTPDGYNTTARPRIKPFQGRAFKF